MSRQKEQISINELRESCDVLGLDFNEFIDNSDELEKGVGNTVNYKEMYKAQLESNQMLLLEVSKLKLSLDGLNEVKKGISEITEALTGLQITPAHAGKSFTQMGVIEKSFLHDDKDAKDARMIISSYDRKTLSKYLGDKMEEEMQKGVTNGLFERAALKYDAYGTLPPDMAQEIYSKDKVLITFN